MTLWLQAGLWGLLAGGALGIGAAVAWLVRVPQRVVAADRLPGLPASEAALESLWFDRRGPEAAGSCLHHDPWGILTHLAWVEEHWFTGMFLGQVLPEPWARADWTVDPDWEWSLAARQSPAQNFALWQQAVARSRDTLTRADDLDALASRGWPDGQRPSLRWIVVHMIEEYARHNGHADLIREAIDGSTGE